MRTKATLIMIVVALVGQIEAHAQFDADFQTNVISGVVSNWAGRYYVGSTTYSDVLIIQDSGGLSNGSGYISYQIASSNNAALVTGPGSTWTNNGHLYVGYLGAGNMLTVTNGGMVIDDYGFLGYFNYDNPSSSNNTALVTGTGSVWRHRNGLSVGHYGANNTLIIGNGGAVFSGGGNLGSESSSSNNTVLVTDPGSTWTSIGNIDVGRVGAHNQLIITNGGAVLSGGGIIGSDFASESNTVVVTGPGSTWYNESRLHVGVYGKGNTLTIGTGGTVISCCAAVGVAAIYSSGRIILTGGSLYITNALGNGQLDIRSGDFTLNSGTATVDYLYAAYPFGGIKSIYFYGGTLHTKDTAIATGQRFVVGNGTNAANFHMLGGVHSFNNGLRIRNHATVSGCGTVNGALVVNKGGTVQADCGRLVFTQSITNNGTLRAVNGSSLETYDTIVNNGVLDIITGSTNFHGAFINNGTILDSNSVHITEVSRSGDDMIVKCLSYVGHGFHLQARDSMTAGSWVDLPGSQPGSGCLLTFTDSGGATNKLSHFYRIRINP